MDSDITQADIDAFLADHTHWDLEDVTITRIFTFADFNEAVGFVTRVAIASEVADHHPDIDVRWNKVKIALSTHSAGALTSKDLKLASTFDEIAA